MPDPQISSERAQSLMKEGKCFYCKEPGHMAINCLVKLRTSEFVVMKPKDRPSEVGSYPVNSESAKQKHLAKVSYLGEVYEFINLEGLDLRRLLAVPGEQSFTVPAQIAFNGCSVPSISSLADSGATGYLFLNSRCANFCKFPSFPSHLHATSTERLVSRSLTPSSRTFVLTEARFLKVPMLITELGKHDMIIGKKWLAEHDVWLDMKNHDQKPEQRTLEAGLEQFGCGAAGPRHVGGSQEEGAGRRARI